MKKTTTTKATETMMDPSFNQFLDDVLQASVVTESDLYQAARDVNGASHCYIASYTPGVKIVIVFPGYPEIFRNNMGRFIETFCSTYRLDPNYSEHTLTVFFGGTR